jgi:hypothetical protein
VANVNSDPGDWQRTRENRYRARGRVAPWLREVGMFLGPVGRTPAFVPSRIAEAASPQHGPYRGMVAWGLLARIVAAAGANDNADRAAAPADRTRRLYRAALDRQSHQDGADRDRLESLRPRSRVDRSPPPPLVLTDTLTRAANAPGLCRVAA